MMRRADAARHARALLEASVRKSDPQRVEQELQAFVALLRQHEPLGKLLLRPGVPPARKRALVASLLASAGADPVVEKLLLGLAERDRLAVLEPLVEAFHARLMQYLGIVEARVTTAVPLPAERQAALERGLAAVTGKRVSLVAEIDPSIIGGVVARVGSTVYDGSVVRQLERMRQRLEQAG